MARYALIQNGTVRNVVEWDGDTTKWSPPANFMAIQTATANIGDSWNGATFTPAPPVAPDPAPPSPTVIQQAIAQLKSTFNTPRTTTQINNSIDALTILLRQAWKDLN